MKHRTLSTAAKTAAILLVAGGVAGGCVARSTYNKDVMVLAEQLTKEREQKKYKVENLEIKAANQGRSLGEITRMYIELQKDYQESQGVLQNLRGDLEALRRDIEELILVVNTNMSGSEADEMVFKLNDMDRRIGRILRKSAQRPGRLRNVPR
ncbi:MAG: hypothetical protein ACE5EI_10830 [Thermodesulfobacteriota bacterium]